MNRASQVTEPRATATKNTATYQRSSPARVLTAAGLSAGLVAAGLMLGVSAPAHAAAPDPDELSANTHGGVIIGEGIGEFPMDLEFQLMLVSEHVDMPEEVEVWALSPDGDQILIGEGETESDTYQNPGSPTYPELNVELIEVNLPSSEVTTTDWYAFTAVDPASGEPLTWTAFPVVLDGDPWENVPDDPADSWPVPERESTGPSSEPPTLENLTEQTYGIVSILRDSPVIPVGEDFTVEVEGPLVDVDLWLLPPGGEDAVFLTSQLAGSYVVFSRWNTLVDSSDVAYNGIYGLVATSESEGLIGWSPFGLSADGESLQPGDPGVHESDAAYSDRSIWPIPDSVPGPDEGQNGSPEPEDSDGDATTEPEGGETENAEPSSPEATEGPEPEGTDAAEPADTEATSSTDQTGWLIIGLAGLGGLLIIGGIAYLIRQRSAQP